MRKYIEIWKYSLKTKLTFLLNYMASLFSFGIHIFVFNELWDYILQGKSVIGYTKSELIWYIIVAEFIIYSFETTYKKIATMVKQGDIANMLIKPIDVITYFFVEASANIVSSTANMAASAQTLAGKEQSAWLNTVSQVAGLVSTATSVAGGFAGGKDAAGNNTASAYQQAGKFGKAMMITQAAGTALSITAQGSTLIKQALGEEAGDFENILNTVGFSLTTAASLAQIGIKISGAAKKGKENTDNTGAESTDKNTDKAGVESTDKNEKIENNQKSDDKVADNKASKEDDSVDDASNTNNEGNTTAVTETVENTAEVQEQQDMVQAAEEAADSAEITEAGVRKAEEVTEKIKPHLMLVRERINNSDLAKVSGLLKELREVLNETLEIQI